MRKTSIDLARIKEQYNHIFQATVLKEKTIYYETLSRLCSGKTLEVACGNNHELLARVKDAVGIDLSEEAAKQLTLKNCRVIVGDVHSLPFNEKAFNTIISLGSLEHFTNARQAVREMHRVLEQGGQLILTVDPEQTLIHKLFYRAKHVYELMIKKKRHDKQPYTFYYNKNKLVHLLFDAGFRITFHGEYSKSCLYSSKKFLGPMLRHFPKKLGAGPYLYFVVAVKGVKGQESTYGPYFPARGQWWLEP